MLNLNPYAELFVDNDSLTFIRTVPKINNTATQTSIATGKLRCSAQIFYRKGQVTQMIILK